MHRAILALVVAGGALALAACASQPKSANQKTAQQKEKMVCFIYTPTGSHVSYRRCMSKEAYATYKKAEQRDSQATQDMLLKMAREGTENAGGDGGGGI